MQLEVITLTVNTGRGTAAIKKIICYSPDPTATLDSNSIIDRTSLNVDHYLINLLSPISISS